MSVDIHALIEEFGQDASSFKDEVKSKVRSSLKGNLNKENSHRHDRNFEEIIHSATIKPSSKISMISRHRDKANDMDSTLDDVQVN